jgi:toxin CptA
VAWRPSRLLIAILVSFALLAPLAVLASEMPRAAAWPLALVAFVSGLCKAYREAVRPACDIVIAAGDAASTIDGRAARDLIVTWRGPLAFLRWRDEDDRTRRLAFWPDTLPAGQRRELRLAASGQEITRSRASMAP